MSEQEIGKKKMLSDWTRQAAEVSSSIAGGSPAAGLLSLSEFASAIAAEGARRVVRGGSEDLGEDSDERVRAQWSLQMAALAKQSMALSRSQKVNKDSSTLGSFVAFYGQIRAAERTDVLNFDANLAASNPRWGQTIESLAQMDGVPLARYAEAAKAPGSTGGPNEFESSFLRQASVGQAWAARDSLSEAAGVSKDGIDAWIDKIGDLKSVVAKSEVESGLSWDAQNASSFFVQNLDATLSAMGSGFVNAIRRSGIDPASMPAIGASLVALSSMMSDSSGGRFLASIPSASDTLEQLASWDTAIIPAWQRSLKKWKAGVVTSAASMPAPRMQVEPVAVSRHDVSAVSPSLNQVQVEPGPSKFYENGRQLGTEIRKVLSGFVDTFSHAKIVEKKMSLMTRTVSSAAGRISENSAINVSNFVDRANEVTDLVEAKLRESLDKGLQAGAQKFAELKVALQSGGQKLDDVMEGAALSVVSGVSSVQSQFVGKVGEAKQAGFGALGALAFKAKDALPSAEKIGIDHGKPMQTKMLKLASIAGALFVGVSMAPAVGVIAASVGAIAAGLGLGSIMVKAVDSARQKVSTAPAALESIGQRLGAKRAERSLDKNDPKWESRPLYGRMVSEETLLKTKNASYPG